MIAVSRRFRFSASYTTKKGTFFGHNFELWVTITGSKHQKFGMICHLTELKSILDPIVDELDHTHLNPSFFSGFDTFAKRIQVALKSKQLVLHELFVTLPHSEAIIWHMAINKQMGIHATRHPISLSNLSVGVEHLQSTVIDSSQAVDVDDENIQKGRATRLHGVELTFYAGHCLTANHATMAENQAMFGPCTNKHGHCFQLTMLNVVNHELSTKHQFLEDDVLLQWLQSLHNAWLNDIFPNEPCTGENMVEWMGETYGHLIDIIDLKETENNRFIWKKHENINYFGY